MKIHQSNLEYITTENDKETRKLTNLLTFRVETYGGDVQKLLLYKKTGKNKFEVPRYTHNLLETKSNRLKISRDKFVTKKVKYPKMKLELRGEQIKAAEAYFKHDDDNILVLPPGSGKTILAANIASQLQEKAIILVHRGAFFNVWKNDIQKALGIPPEEVGEIRGDKLTIGEQFTVATFQTLHSRELDIYDEFGLVIADECLVGDTLIEMKDGTKKPIRDIKNGDKVLGGTVSNKFCKIVPKTIKVESEGRSYQSSLNHPIMTVKIEEVMDGITKTYKLERKRSIDLKEGDLLALRCSDKMSINLNRRRGREDFQEVLYRGRVPYRIVKVENTTIVDKPSIVYDFTTTSHTFTANGFLSSNCHHVPADSFSAVTSRFRAKHMLGLTGTFERTDGLHMLANLFLGRIAYYNDEADLDHVEMATIYRIHTGTNIPLRPHENIHHMYHKLLSHKDRFSLFLELFKLSHEKGRKQLIFMHSKTYAQMYTAILNHLGYKVMSAMGQNGDRNAEAKELMLSGKLDAIVATVQFLKEGESINNLDTLHMLTPITNKTDWRQSIARGQRQHPDKKHVVVFDYVDEKLQRCWRHFENRIMWSKETNSHKYETTPFVEDLL